MKFARLTTAPLFWAATVSAISQVSVWGNKFFSGDGQQFFLKGVAYQLTPHDPLIDTVQCGKDAALMQKLGANSIRVYHVDPTADHSGCMSTFAAAGIYLLVDLDTFSTYILPATPYWNQTQYNAYAAVVDAFAKFDNTLGFFIGNEIIAQVNDSAVAPFIKAATRDMKAYIKSKGYRQIPVGYSAADIAELRPMLQNYLTCGGNSSENVDFFSLNSYEWCDPSTYLTSGYKNLESMVVNFPVPIFFSETGCNTPGPRLFEDQDAIFGSNMVGDWSGALIYEWIEETNHYGLISYGPKVDPSNDGPTIVDGYTRQGEPTPISPDFYNLKSRWDTIKPTGVAASAYNIDQVSTRACPGSTAGGWIINGNVALPTLGQTYQGAYAASPTVSIANSGSPTFTDSPSGTPGNAGSAASTKQNPAPANREIAGMGAALFGVMLFFTFWL